MAKCFMRRTSSRELALLHPQFFSCTRERLGRKKGKVRFAPRRIVFRSTPSNDPITRTLERAWTDPTLKLLTDPKEAAAEMGVKLPEPRDLQVWENTDTVAYRLLPVAPKVTELSDADLEAVAGGGLSKGAQTPPGAGCAVALGVHCCRDYWAGLAVLNMPFGSLVLASIDPRWWSFHGFPRFSRLSLVAGLILRGGRSFSLPTEWSAALTQSDNSSLAPCNFLVYTEAARPEKSASRGEIVLQIAEFRCLWRLAVAVSD